VWSGRAVGRLALDCAANAGVDLATATLLAGAFTDREGFAGRPVARLDATRFSVVGFLVAFAAFFVARRAARAGLGEVRFVLAVLLAFFLGERTGTLGLRRLAARPAGAPLFAFFAMTV
jgi:hypothetical protein